jgi:hypothetical protein
MVTKIRRLKESDILAELKVFEEKYEMSSDEFLVKWDRGELGDDRHWFRWSALCLMLDSVRNPSTPSVKT